MRAGVIKIIGQRTKYDCAVACVAMVAGVPYDEARELFPRRLNNGSSERVILRALRLLGCTVSEARRYDRFKDRGILMVDEHAVVLWNGVIIDTDMLVWEPGAWFSVTKPKGVYLLRVS